MLKKAGSIRRFTTPQPRDYPARLKDPQGYWAVPNNYFDEKEEKRIELFERMLFKKLKKNCLAGAVAAIAVVRS